MESVWGEELPIYRHLRSYSQRVFSVFGDKVPVPTVMATVITKGQVQDIDEQSCDILDMDVGPRMKRSPGRMVPISSRSANQKAGQGTCQMFKPSPIMPGRFLEMDARMRAGIWILNGLPTPFSAMRL